MNCYINLINILQGWHVNIMARQSIVWDAIKRSAMEILLYKPQGSVKRYFYIYFFIRYAYYIHVIMSYIVRALNITYTAPSVA